MIEFSDFLELEPQEFNGKKRTGINCDLNHQANLGQNSLDAYFKTLTHSQNLYGDDEHSPIVDLMVDLMHLCERKKLDPITVLSDAWVHFTEER